MKIVLASTSPYRQQQLSNLGLQFDSIKPEVDEESLKDLALAPAELAHKLAHAKGQSLLPRLSEDVVISGDQLVDFNGLILGKADSPEAAVKQLLQLSGKTHYLITAVCVFHQGRELCHTDVTRLTMRDLSEQQIKNYIDFDKAWDCAGSYKLECAGQGLFSQIESKDHSAIIGLPLIAVVDSLLEFGVPLPFL